MLSRACEHVRERLALRYSEVFGFPALGRAAYGGVKVRF
jgi:hypothetical protein